MEKEEALEKRQQIPATFGLAICAIAAFLMTGASFNGLESPLQVGLAAAVQPPYAIAVLAGSLCSYWVTGQLSGAAVILCALVVTVLVRWVVAARLSAGASACLAGGCVLLSTLAFAATGAIRPAQVLLYVCMGALAGISAYFLREVFGAWRERDRLRISTGNGFAFGIAYILAVAVFASASVSLFNIGQMLGAFVVLTAVREYRLTGGAVAGILTGAGMLLCSPELGYSAICMGIAGLAAGCFCEVAPLGYTALFVAVQAAGLLLVGAGAEGGALVVNLLIGGTAFLLVPTGFVLERVLPQPRAEKESADMTAVRMGFLSQSLCGIRKDAEKVARMLERSACKQETVRQVSDAVCRKCRHMLHCWDDAYPATQEAFAGFAAKRGLTAAHCAQQLPDCLHPDKLSEEFARQRQRADLARSMSVRLSETQGLLFTQMRVTEDILQAAGERMQIRYCAEQTRQVRAALEREAFPVHSVLVYRNQADRLCMELYAQADALLDGGSVCDFLSESLRLPLSYTEAEVAGSELRLCLWEQTAYATESYAAQLSASDDEPSGDHFESFPDGRGYQYLVISDGMGSGKKASLDSRLVLANFKRLIQAGVAWKTAIEMVNALMLTKSPEESFATLDIARLDLESGAVTLIKSGASSTLVRQGEVVTMYQAPTYPIGIVPRTEPYVRELPLAQEDVLVMLTDGVEDHAYRFIKACLLESNDLQSCAKKICQYAKEHAGDHADDITVFLTRLRKQN